MEQLILWQLNNNKNISQISDKSYSKMHCGKSYQYIYSFIYTLDKKDIRMVIGIPIDWDRKLIDVFIENFREFDYIPHFDKNGKLCLFDLEGILIDKNFEGLLNQTLSRVEKTLYDGLNKLNTEDFIEEFEQYWARLPEAKILKSMVNTTGSTKMIKYADNQKIVKGNKNDKYVDVLNKEKRFSIVASDLEKDINLYPDMNMIRNGIYIYINTKEYIYPPDWRKKLDIEYINNLINNISLDKDEIFDSIKKCKSNLLLVFNVKQPNDCVNIFGVIINGYEISMLNSRLYVQSHRELIPCSVKRCDKEFLINRGGALSGLYNKRILVIGCGSIGGYLINELVKTGINNITVVDDDILKEENIYRHLLGMEYINQYKSVSIVGYLRKNIPNVSINSVEDAIEDAVYDGSVSLSEYDLIISAVGNHNVNRWINEYIHANNVRVPAVYMWNEVLGIGNHVAFISTEFTGCYECFFEEGEEGVYDRTSYCERGQIYAKKVRGCGSSYLPFGSIDSIKTAITGIEIIKDYFNGRINNNYLISIKGDGNYLKNLGFKTSNRYNVQPQNKTILEGEKFLKESCSICGDK